MKKQDSINMNKKESFRKPKKETTYYYVVKSGRFVRMEYKEPRRDSPIGWKKGPIKNSNNKRNKKYPKNTKLILMNIQNELKEYRKNEGKKPEEYHEWLNELKRNGKTNDATKVVVYKKKTCAQIYKEKYRYFCPVKLESTGKRCTERYRAKQHLIKHLKEEHNMTYEEAWLPLTNKLHANRKKKDETPKEKKEMSKKTKQLNEILKKIATDDRKFITKRNKTTDIHIQKDEINVLPTTRITCNKCGNKRATWILRQMRSSDEPESRFYTCTKCKHKWRED
jgi:DNA-directed RNA polymerase subunit M/transcription elongation factor TFIIS